MSTVTTAAAAKINLTLQVHGRRRDGYHSLSSAVVFARDVRDDVALHCDQPDRVLFAGPFARGIELGSDTLSATLKLLRNAHPDLQLGAVTVDKHIPLASGLGGGSADAAALLRLVRANNPDQDGPVDWLEIAQKIGADVPVCMASTAQFMCGVGEQLTPLRAMPDLFAVLIAPEDAAMANKTQRVFQALAAPEIGAVPPTLSDAATPPLKTPRDVAELVHLHGNDLLEPAQTVMPALRAPLTALQSLDRCLTASLSGAGPTVFGLFVRRADAEDAARDLVQAHPNWWVRVTALD